MKGALFTIDILIAIIIATSMLATIANVESAQAGNEREVLRLNQNSKDILTTADKLGELEKIFTESDSQIQGELNSLLNSTANNLKAKITIKTYKYTPSGGCGVCNLDGTSPISEFCTCRKVSTTIFNITGPDKTISSSKRLLSNLDSKEMAIATIEVAIR